MGWPAKILWPAAGVVLTTMRLPLPVEAAGGVEPGVVAGGGVGCAAWVLMVGTCIPASTITLIASSSLRPTRSGMTKESVSGAAAISRLIFGSDTLTAFAGGLCAMIWSGGAFGIAALATAPSSKPRRRMLISAARSLLP